MQSLIGSSNSILSKTMGIHVTGLVTHNYAQCHACNADSDGVFHATYTTNTMSYLLLLCVLDYKSSLL